MLHLVTKRMFGASDITAELNNGTGDWYYLQEYRMSKGGHVVFAFAVTSRTTGKTRRVGYIRDMYRLAPRVG